MSAPPRIAHHPVTHWGVTATLRVLVRGGVVWAPLMVVDGPLACGVAGAVGFLTALEEVGRRLGLGPLLMGIALYLGAYAAPPIASGQQVYVEAMWAGRDPGRALEVWFSWGDVLALTSVAWWFAPLIAISAYQRVANWGSHPTQGMGLVAIVLAHTAIAVGFLRGEVFSGSPSEQAAALGFLTLGVGIYLLIALVGAVLLGVLDTVLDEIVVWLCARLKIRRRRAVPVVARSRARFTSLLPDAPSGDDGGALTPEVDDPAPPRIPPPDTA